MEKQQNKSGKFERVVLIPTDFSPVCNNAVRHGVELAKSLKYDAYILHVIDQKVSVKNDDEVTERAEIDKKMKAYTHRYEKGCDIKINTLVREGRILQVINEVAEEVRANLMIMGTHGKKGFQKIFGSYALKVVLDSPCPVIVVQNKGFENGYKNIVLPVSNTMEARSTVQWAILIAKLFNSRVHLFQALETDPVLNSRLSVVTGQITALLDTNEIPYELVVANKTANFASQVILFSTVNQMDLIMILTVPLNDVPGFNVTAWDEKMMFNEDGIPVMCINPTEITDYYFEWLTRL